MQEYEYIEHNIRAHAAEMTRLELHMEDGIMMRSKLQVLLYYAQGFSLAYNNCTLFPDEIYISDATKAIKIQAVVDDFPDRRTSITWNDHLRELSECVTSKEKPIIDHAFYVYGIYASWYLLKMIKNSHLWQSVCDAGESIINIDEMKKYFSDLLESPHYNFLLKREGLQKLPKL